MSIVYMDQSGSLTDEAFKEVQHLEERTRVNTTGAWTPPCSDVMWSLANCLATEISLHGEMEIII